MGEQSVHRDQDDGMMRVFMKALLNDVRALERMLDDGMFETGIRRIGAEQEMFLVNAARLPAHTAEAIMARVNDPRLTYELAKFNLEANLTPQVLGGDCLRKMERELTELMALVRDAASKEQTDIVLSGILPTLKKSDLSLDSMIPNPRYRALNDAIMRLRGSEFGFSIKGTDSLDIQHDNVMLEACNASYQIHFQVEPDEFASLYNMAQVVTAPVIAAAVNSPLLLGKRLWHETRIAVFENSVDARSDLQKARGTQPRVHFGDHWIEDSVMEIYKEDIARFRVVLTNDGHQDPMELLDQGKVPGLDALRLHNGTVYRWNRACYGITDGKPHLRIEHRTLPSGPSIIDEVANSALFFGLMSEMIEHYPDIREHIAFDDARANFLAASRYGLQAQFRWLDGQQMTAQTLIQEHLLPMARQGLARVGIRKTDIDRYMNVIDKRTGNGQTGARWMLDSMKSMDGTLTSDEALRNLTSSIIKNQVTDRPIHRWRKAELCEQQDWRDSYRTVGQFMTTDLFTVQADDLIDFAASIMEWKHIRHVPVENDQGQLVGLVSHRDLLRIIARGDISKQHSVAVSDIMTSDPLSISPDTATVEAIRLMRQKKLACLPVVKDDKLVGVITEGDMLFVAGKLLERFLEEG